MNENIVYRARETEKQFWFIPTKPTETQIDEYAVWWTTGNDA